MSRRRHNYQLVPVTERRVVLAGSGGGKSGGDAAGGTPTEDPDSLQSRSFARVIDVLSEGEIEGFVHTTFPLLDIYLDGTAIQNNDAWGTRTDGQTTINSTRFQVPTDVFEVYVNKKGVVKPFKSGMVGRWIVGTNIPYATYIVSVESARSLTLSAAATATGTGLSWTLGGTLNYKRFTWQYRSGTQNQSPFQGFNALEVTSGDGRRIYAGPTNRISHVFYDTTLDACRLDVRFRLLEETDNNGNVHGSEVKLKIFVNNSKVVEETVSGKASAPYIRTYHIDFASFPGVRTVAVERVTPDSQNQQKQNDCYADSWTEVTYGKLRYSNTAAIALRVSAEQFQNIPSRAYHIKGVKVKIPSNYDPVTRVYTGTWDGTFKSSPPRSWTDNPAWCFYDLCTNTRYGLGHMLIEANLDKWTLYTIGQYCDQMVNNGYGGTEPRFTCNLYLQRAEDAIKVIQDMAGIFRGVVAYINGSITPIQDSPADPSSYRMFSPANVVNGTFTYSGVSLRARHNVAVVSYSDLNDGGKIKQEYVEDHDSITKLGGVNRLEMTGFGCTSRGQARRIGLWAIYAEKILTDTVVFQTALEGYYIKPGQIIQIQDPFRAGSTYSGRLKSGSTNTHLYLDRSIVIAGSGATYTVGLIDPVSGLLVTKSVTQGAGTWSDITCSSFGFASPPENGAIFQIARTDTAGALYPELFRVTNVSLKEANAIEITALEYNASLYDFVDFNHPLTEPPISNLPPTGGVIPPTHFQAAVLEIIKPDHSIQQDIIVTWFASTDRYIAGYRPTWRKDNGNWHGTRGELDTSVNLFEMPDARVGDYDFSIYTVNTLGVLSPPLHGEATVVAPTGNAGITGLELFGGANNTTFQTRDAHFVWRVSSTRLLKEFQVEFYNDITLLWSDRTSVSEYIYTWELNRDRAEAVYGAGTLPFNRFRIEVRAVFLDDTLSGAATLTVTNPDPAAPIDVTKNPAGQGVAFQWTNPSDPDIDHVDLFASVNINNNDPDQVATFHGTSGIYYPPTNQNWHYWLAEVDSFGNKSTPVPVGFTQPNVVQQPTFTPPAGSYSSTQYVAISETTTNCTLYYCLVPIGQNPTSWIQYTTAITISTNRTLWGLAVSNFDPSHTNIRRGDYHITHTGGGNPPANDNFANRTTLTGDNGGPTVGTTANATRETGEPGTGVSVWYAWTPSQAWIAHLQIGNAWSKIEVYTGSGFPLTTVTTSGTSQSCYWTATAGVNYKIRLTPNGQQAAFQLRWSLRNPAPPNDNFGSAENLSGSSGGPTPGTNVNAGTEAGEPLGNNTVWYKWTAPNAYDTFFNVNPGATLKLRVYTGTAVNALSEVTYVVADTEGWVSWTAAAGTNYKIRVENRAGTAPFQLRWTQITPPANNSFAGRTTVSGQSCWTSPNTGPIAGTTFGATREIGEPEGDNSVWYQWSTFSAGLYIGFWAGSSNFVIEAYTGTAVNALTLVAVSGDDGVCWFRTVAATAYKIRVRSDGVGAPFSFYWYTPIVSSPTFDPEGGYFQLDQPARRMSVTITCGTPNAWLYITNDGTDPTPTHYNYWVPRTLYLLSLTEGEYDIRAIGHIDGWIDSDIHQGTYTLALKDETPCATPAFSPLPGTYTFPVTVTIHCSEPSDAVIRYTTDGTIPTRQHGTSIANNGTAVLTTTCFLKAIAYRRGRANSLQAIGRYRNPDRLLAPTFNPTAGAYSTFPMSVAITARDLPGTQIFYTTDGTTPSNTHGNQVQGVTPNMIAGLRSWYKADDLLLTLSEGDPVASWPDATPLGINLTGRGAPTFRTNQLNGLPVVRFNGTDQYFDADVNVNLIQPNTIIIVAKATSVTATAGRFLDSFGGINARQLLGITKTNGYFDMYAGKTVNDSSNHSGAFHIFTGLYNGTTSKAYFDGVLRFTGDVGTYGLDTVRLGHDSGIEFLNGDIAEVLIYDSVLSDKYRQQVETYLGIKYNIGGPYYANTGLVTLPTPGLTLKAITYSTGYVQSPVGTAVYTGKLATPTFTPDSCYYTQGGSLNVNIDVPGAPTFTIVYVTYDGSDPSRTHFDDGFAMPFPATVVITGGYRELKAIAVNFVDTRYTDSDIKDATYDWLP